ncbi:MAG: hypothetical protein ACFFBD_26800 [Candidatus Hodarchaeota archaeon]
MKSNVIFKGSASVSVIWQIFMILLKYEEKEHLTRSRIAAKINKSEALVSKVIKELLNLKILNIEYDSQILGTSKHYIELNIPKIVSVLVFEITSNEEIAKEYEEEYVDWLYNDKYQMDSTVIDENIMNLFDDRFIGGIMKKIPQFFLMILLLVDITRRKDKTKNILRFNMISFVIFSGKDKSTNKTPVQDFLSVPQKILVLFFGLGYYLSIRFLVDFLPSLFSRKVLDWWRRVTKDKPIELDISYEQAKNIFLQKDENIINKQIQNFMQIAQLSNFYSLNRSIEKTTNLKPYSPTWIKKKVLAIDVENLQNKELIDTKGKCHIKIPLKDGSFEDLSVNSFRLVDMLFFKDNNEKPLEDKN